MNPVLNNNDTVTPELCPHIYGDDIHSLFYYFLSFILLGR